MVWCVISIRMRHSGSQARDKEIPETMVCRILVFRWSFGPLASPRPIGALFEGGGGVGGAPLFQGVALASCTNMALIDKADAHGGRPAKGWDFLGAARQWKGASRGG